MPNSSHTPPLFQPGTLVLERYRLHQKLGQAFSRQTWFAQDCTCPDPEAAQVVLKLLFGGEALQWEHYKLFEREAQVLKQLNHPAIPNCRDFFNHPEQSVWCGLVEDYVPGQSLKDLVRGGQRFAEPEIRRIASDILNVLIYLHGLNPAILHRDLKPSNLILDEANHIHVIDFGAVQAQATPVGSTLTVVGTSGFAPMEQFMGRSVPASDLYGLGMTLINLMTGVAPADLPQTNLKVQFRDRITCSEALMGWLECLTEPAPEKRFASAQAALTVLESRAHPITAPLKQLPQPKHSKIRLYQDQHTLTVRIPFSKRNAWGISATFGILSALSISTLFMLAMTPNVGSFVIVLLVFLTMTAGIVYGALFEMHKNVADVYIEINQNLFSIRHFMFNTCYLKREIPLADIILFSIVGGSYHPPLFEFPNETIKIHTATTTFTFGRCLKQSECNWLLLKLKPWLDSYSN